MVHRTQVQIIVDAVDETRAAYCCHALTNGRPARSDAENIQASTDALRAVALFCDQRGISFEKLVDFVIDDRAKQAPKLRLVK